MDSKVLLIIFVFVCSQNSLAQDKFKIRKVDFSNEGYRYAGIASSSATKDGKWICVLIRSNIAELNYEIESLIVEFYKEGNTNIALMSGSMKDGKNEISAYWDGARRAGVNNPDASISDTIKFMREILIEGLERKKSGK